MGALGTDADQNYVPLLRQKLVEVIVAAEANLEQAEVGWGSVSASEYTAVRRWVRRPDRVGVDPFGNPTVRANMHAARNLDDAIGPTGPEDPELSIISFRGNKDKRPLAALANFSMHYFSDTAISADYFGLFSNGLQALMWERDPRAKSFVAMMSHGCSGDIWRRDYFLPAPSPDVTIADYSQICSPLHQKLTMRSSINRMQLWRWRRLDCQCVTEFLTLSAWNGASGSWLKWVTARRKTRRKFMRANK